MYNSKLTHMYIDKYFTFIQYACLFILSLMFSTHWGIPVLGTYLLNGLSQILILEDGDGVVLGRELRVK